MSDAPRPEETLSTTQTARRLGVDEQTVRDMCNDGRLPCTRNGHGHRRIPESAVETLRVKWQSEGRKPRAGRRRDFQATVTAEVEGMLSDAAIELICEGVASRMEQREAGLATMAQRVARSDEALKEAIRRVPFWRRRRFVAWLHSLGLLSDCR
jgi:excisionase family DNA binding protein